MQPINEDEDEYEDGEDEYELELNNVELEDEEDENQQAADEYIAASARATWLRLRDANNVGLGFYAACQLAYIGLSKFSLILMCFVCLYLTRISEECAPGAFLCIEISSLGLLVLEIGWNIPAVHIFPPRIDPLTKHITPRLRRRLMRTMEITTWMLDWYMLFWTIGLALEYDQCAVDMLLTANGINLLVLSFFCSLL